MMCALVTGVQTCVLPISRVRAEPGYERALAAALGDDLDAAVGERDAVRVWMGAAHEADPPLPQGVESLAARVTAPPELARRLAQVGVAETDDGAISLGIGQRLVTRDGVQIGRASCRERVCQYV